MSPMSARHAGLLAICAAAACAAAHIHRELQKKNSSEVLAKALRRQLMKDNYDYSSNDSEGKLEEKIITVENKDSKKEEEGTSDKSLDIKNTPSVQIQYRRRSYANKEFINKAVTHKGREKHYKKSRKRRKRREYLYDFNNYVAKRYQSRYRGWTAREDAAATERDMELATTVQYKVLKFKKPYRRSGFGVAVIQEESPSGVSVLRVGAGPVPEFRLAGRRGQYMRAPRPPLAPGDEELPPPAVEAPPSETTPSPADAPITRITDTPHNPHNIKDDFLNSLKITVTPDEIFVL